MVTAIGAMGSRLAPACDHGKSVAPLKASFLSSVTGDPSLANLA
jgi:hypothetical protein